MTTYPMLVIGSGEIASQVLEHTVRLLRSFRSPVEHIVAIGRYEAGKVEKLHIPHVGISGQFVNPFAEWMCRIRAEKSLEKVRNAAISVGPAGGYLLVNILLVVDSNRTDSIPEIVRMLEEAVQSLQEKIPPRLHLLIIHPHSGGFVFPTIQDVDALIQSELLTLASKWTLAPMRSDGSVLAEDDFLSALPYLLFAALQPTDHGDEHWLLRKPLESGEDWLVPGFGLVVLPLPEIEEALSHQLLADAYSVLNTEPEAPPELTPELQPEETAWWQRLLQAIPKVAGAGAGLTLSLQQDTPELSRAPHRWLQETDEWDARWRKETLPQNEQALQAAANEMLEAFRSYLRQYIQNNMLVSRGALPLLRFALDKAAQAMDRWTVLKTDLKEPDSETIQSARTRFEQALERLPERGKLLTIAALITLVLWVLLQGVLWLLSPHLGAYLWWAVAAMAILPPVVAGGGAYLFYRRRRMRLQECWDDYLARLHAQHAELLRWRALQVLRNAAAEMKEVITSELQRAQNLQQDIHTRVSLWRQAGSSVANSFAPTPESHRLSLETYPADGRRTMGQARPRQSRAQRTGGLGHPYDSRLARTYG